MSQELVSVSWLQDLSILCLSSGYLKVSTCRLRTSLASSLPDTIPHSIYKGPVKMATETPLPSSNVAVDVKIIDTTTYMRVPVGAFNADKIPGHDFFDAPSYAFLIEHASGKKLLFDLGMRPDLDGFSPVVQERLKGLLTAGSEAKIEKGVAQVLKEHGVEPAEIGAVIWR